MTKLTFLHTGDEHIDSDAHGTLNPITGRNTAWESNYAVMRFLAETAVERKVDAFISAGDSFKTGRPSQEALLLFADAYSPLAEAKIPIVLLDGNHNMTGVPSDHRTAIHVVAAMLRSLGGIVHVASDPQLIRLDSGLQIAALPWLSKNRILNALEAEDLTPAQGDARVAEYAIELLTKFASQADDKSPLILASHVTVDDLRIDAVTKGHERGSEMELAHLFSEPVLARKELEKLPFAYGALSHIHTPQHMGKTLHYSGSPNRLTFTDMKDSKAGNLVAIEDDGTMSVEYIKTPARVMVSIDLDQPGASVALDALEPGHLVQVLLETGSPEVPREIRKAISTAGAILADTKARPAPREQVAQVVIAEKVDPATALRTWAETNLPDGLDVELLLTAASHLEAA
jgi:exonuclease SbcD